MDWSNIYENSGNEVGSWPMFARAAIISQLREGTYTPAVAYIFSVNYILGVGALGIPFGFLKAGYLQGVAIVCCCSCIAFLTVVWVAKASYRAAQRQNLRLEAARAQRPSHYGATDGSPTGDSSEDARKHGKDDVEKAGHWMMGGVESEESTPAFGPLPDPLSSLDPLFSPGNGLDLLAKRNPHSAGGAGEAFVEVTECALEYLGPVGKYVYQFNLMLLTYTGLVAYTQVFVQGLASQIHFLEPSVGQNLSDWVGVGLPTLAFASVAVPLSCCEITEQITIQVVMSILRFVSMGVIVFGTIVALVYDDPAKAAAAPGGHVLDAVGGAVGGGASGGGAAAGRGIASVGGGSAGGTTAVPWADSSGFGVMFSLAVFSQLFQHSVPGLVRPLLPHHHTRVPMVFFLAVATTGTLYILTGCLTVLYFKTNTMQSINLNFAHFDWGVSPSRPWGHLAAVVLAKLVLLFPVLDTLSVFPLIAITLGNNLRAFFPSPLPLSASPRLQSIFWRCAAAVPPVMLSVLVSDLSLTLQAAGASGVIVALVFPSLLEIYSRHPPPLLAPTPDTHPAPATLHLARPAIPRHSHSDHKPQEYGGEHGGGTSQILPKPGAATPATTATTTAGAAAESLAFGGGVQGSLPVDDHPFAFPGADSLVAPYIVLGLSGVAFGACVLQWYGAIVGGGRPVGPPPG